MKRVVFLLLLQLMINFLWADEVEKPISIEWFLTPLCIAIKTPKEDTAPKIFVRKRAQVHVHTTERVSIPYKIWIANWHYQRFCVKAKKQEVVITFPANTVSYIKELHLQTDKGSSVQIDIHPDAVVFVEYIRLSSRNGGILKINGMENIKKLVSSNNKRFKIPLKNGVITLVGLTATRYCIQEVETTISGWGDVKINQKPLHK